MVDVPSRPAAMEPHSFVPREGGVKIVFDVPEHDVQKAAAQVAEAGFEVHRYYHSDDEHAAGGSPDGYVRLGAQRAMTEFTVVEQNQVERDFDAAQRASGLHCERVGTDVWTAGNADGLAGDREPRRPLPKILSGTSAVDS